MGRRAWMLSVGALAIGIRAAHVPAQPKKRAGTARIALLDDAGADVRAALWDTFRRRLDEIGYTVGQDVVIEARWAGGDLQRLPALAKELVDRRPHAMVVVTTTVALVAKRPPRPFPSSRWVRPIR